MIFKNNFYQLFLERERAAQLAESKTDELIKDAPTTQHDKSGEWQETSGEIQWVSTEKTDGTEEKHKKEEDDEELDLNKGMFVLSSSIFTVRMLFFLSVSMVVSLVVLSVTFLDPSLLHSLKSSSRTGHDSARL